MMIDIKGHTIKINKEDAALIIRKAWRPLLLPKGRIYFKSSNDSYLHRIIAGAKKGQLVDHRNMDTLDNTRANLRIATPSQNQFNSNKHKNNTTGFKGVRLHSGRRKPWSSEIRKDYKRYFLGYFSTAIEAHEAYRRMVLVLAGEFARW